MNSENITANTTTNTNQEVKVEKKQRIRRGMPNNVTKGIAVIGARAKDIQEKTATVITEYMKIKLGSVEHAKLLIDPEKLNTETAAAKATIMPVVMKAFAPNADIEAISSELEELFVVAKAARPTEEKPAKVSRKAKMESLIANIGDDFGKLLEAIHNLNCDEKSKIKERAYLGKLLRKKLDLIETSSEFDALYGMVKPEYLVNAKWIGEVAIHFEVAKNMIKVKELQKQQEEYRKKVMEEEKAKPESVPAVEEKKVVKEPLDTKIVDSKATALLLNQKQADEIANAFSDTFGVDTF